MRASKNWRPIVVALLFEYLKSPQRLSAWVHNKWVVTAIIERVQLSCIHQMWERGNRGNKNFNNCKVKSDYTSENHPTSSPWSWILWIDEKIACRCQMREKFVQEQYFVWYWNYHKSAVHELGIEMLMKWTRTLSIFIQVCKNSLLCTMLIASVKVII